MDRIWFARTVTLGLALAIILSSWAFAQTMPNSVFRTDRINTIVVATIFSITIFIHIR